MDRYSSSVQQDREFAVCVLEDRNERAIARLAPEIGNNLFCFESGGCQVVLPPSDLCQLQGSPFFYGTPFLFPPNRVRQARFTHRGRQYHLPQNAQGHHLHGEFGTIPWRVADTGANGEAGAFVRSEFRVSEHPEVEAYFPHELVFSITYLLKDGQLTLLGEVSNEGTEAAPYALGFHPYFHLASRSVAADAIRLTMTADEEWPVTADGFVEGRSSDTDLCAKLREGAQLSAVPAKGYSFFSVPRRANRFEIADELLKYKVVLETDEHFPFMAVFRPPWAEALSLEPYTCATDCFNLDVPAETSGAQSIEPGQTFRFSWRVRRELMRR